MSALAWAILAVLALCVTLFVGTRLRAAKRWSDCDRDTWP